MNEIGLNADGSTPSDATDFSVSVSWSKVNGASEAAFAVVGAAGRMDIFFVCVLVWRGVSCLLLGGTGGFMMAAPNAADASTARL